MEIPVHVEPIAGNGYRARGGQPLPLAAEGPTREAALANLRAQLQARLRNGAEIVSLQLTPAPHPLAEFVGMFKDDPLCEEWKQSMAEYRRQVDATPDLP